MLLAKMIATHTYKRNQGQNRKKIEEENPKKYYSYIYKESLRHFCPAFLFSDYFQIIGTMQDSQTQNPSKSKQLLGNLRSKKTKQND